MNPRPIVPVLAILGLSACVAQGPDPDDSAPGDFYEGRTLEIIVPFGPGGGTDTWTRMMAPHLQERLGRGSAVQVVNLAGATSVAGANDFALRRRHDGLTALVSSGSTFFPFLVGEPMVRYDFADFRAIVASPVGYVIFVSPDLDVTEATDLVSLDIPLVFGGISATGNDLVMLVAFEVLHLHPQTILGYSTRGETRIAFERGETNIEYQTLPAYQASVVPLVEAGAAVPLFTFGLLDEDGQVVRDPVVPDLPSLREVYVAAYGTEPSGVEWDAYKAVLAASVAVQKVMWLHGDAPEAAIRDLREAAAKLVQDTSFLRIAYAEVGDYPFYVGETAQRLFSSAMNVPPESLLWLKSLLRTKYGVTRF